MDARNGDGDTRMLDASLNCQDILILCAGSGFPFQALDLKSSDLWCLLGYREKKKIYVGLIGRWTTWVIMFTPHRDI